MRKIFFSLFFIGAFFTFPLKVSASTTDQLYFALTAQDGSFDRFYLEFADNFSEGYGIEDAVTLSTFFDDQPAFWSVLEESSAPLVVQGFPMIDNRVVRLGFSVPGAGTYTISMQKLLQTDLRSIVLIDNVTGIETNLLTTPTYTFSTTGTVNVNESRFTLLINYITVTPMLVSGNVLISGPMRSDGQVHVFSGTNVGKIDIDNTSGATLKADTIILYSDDTSDGLLRNLNTTTSGGGVQGIATAVQPAKVIMRKTFEAGKYTYFSLPFPVTPNGVLTAGTSSMLAGGTDYGAWGFDAQVRSENMGFTNPAVWKEIDYTPATGGFAKGMGYQFYYVAGGNVDFITTNAADINSLFAQSSKTVNYTMYMSGSNSNSVQAQLDAGWAFIGGLNSTVYALNGTNIPDYAGGTVWYRDMLTSQATNSQSYSSYKEVVLSGSETLNVGPYTPFYIQGSIVSPGNAPGTFTYSGGGLSLENVTFRSSNEEPIKDQLYFVLSSDNNKSFDRFYLNFADNYVESYRAIEDAVKMSTHYTKSPAVWSLLDGANQPLVVNGLPMKDEREVQMGFSVPEAGDYTISLEPLHQQDVKNVILVDNVTGKKVDLLQTSYSFNTGTVDGENGRFALYINSSYTGTPTIKSDEVYTYVKDNLLTVKNLSEGDKVQVLDLAGRTVASGNASGKEFSVALSQKGIYIVNVKGEKASVVKVLNK